MKVILVCQKSEIDSLRLTKIKSIAPVIWYDTDKTDLHQVKELFDADEKILALSPLPIDWSFPADLYSKLNNVKAISLVTTDYSYIDLQECQKQRILVTNIPHYATEAVAQNAIFMMFALLRRLPQIIKSDYKYEFTPDNLGDDFIGKKVGIIGLGDIGQRIAQISTSLGLKTLYWSLNKKPDFEYKDLRNLLSESDIIFPTFINSPQTQNFLNQDLLSLLKDSVYFISVISEKLWDKQYLINRAESGKLAGLAYETDTKHEILKKFKGNVLPLPSFGWYTAQSLENNIQIWTNTTISLIENHPLNLVYEFLIRN